MRRRALPLAAVVGLIVLAASACATDVCPAIGWSNQVIVTAESVPAEAADLRLCIDGSCTGDAAEVADAPVQIATEIPEPAEPSVEQDGLAHVSVERLAEDQWIFTLHDMSTPETVTVKVTDAAGEPVAETRVDLVWQFEQPHGPRCGGPGTARASVSF